ncbi:PEPxxWA-CTERM sorting domain-containing protein [Qipengyuania sediminis]|uniref:PEPxxWA-CTERM sorting domain-containing protein n=1 Tax=Qipengyuania sediminis TaxID=1532023 RepID=UPI001980C69D|nr:PEPxxWA-CTERM sorting domain-containing protein [Qipengyuania sediminis]
MKPSYLLAATAFAALGTVSPASAATLIGTFSGNDCTGSFSNCFATQSGVNVAGGALASSAVIKFNGNQADGNIPPLGLDEVSSNYPSVTGGEFARAFNSTTNVFSFTYTPGAGDPALHYFAIKQGRSYALYYSAAPILSDSVDLDIAFGETTDDFSHVTFFNSRVPAVPEPGTWAMMILGFGVIGGALRRSRKQRVTLHYA